MIDTKELRLLVQDYKLVGLLVYIRAADMDEILNRLEAAEKERDALRAKIEAMERQEPSHWGCTVLQSDGRWKEEVSREAPPEGYFSIRDIFPLYALPGAQPAWSSQAVLDITAERRRQIEVECWTPEHDDEHRAGEMAKAAACYALVSAGFNPDAAGSMWPWRRRWWKPSDKRRDLIKAGALILAEVERLDRTAEVERKMK